MMSSPQACSTLPSLSSSITGCLPRLYTHTLSSLSTETPAHSPKCHPGGSFAQFLTTLWGSGGPDFNSAQPLVAVTARAATKKNQTLIDILLFCFLLRRRRAGDRRGQAELRSHPPACHADNLPDTGRSIYFWGVRVKGPNWVQNYSGPELF